MKNKQCNKCNTTKPISEFYKQKDCKYGVRTECKVCACAYRKKYYSQNKETLLVQMKEYNDLNKDAIREQKKEYYDLNKDAFLEYNREYRRNNPEKSIEYTTRRRAKKKGVNESYTQDKRSIVEITFDGKCFNCGSMERIEHDHHYCLNDGFALDIGNAVLLCKSCNSSKYTKDPADFYTEEQLKDLETLFKVQQDLYKLEQIDKYL